MRTAILITVGYSLASILCMLRAMRNAPYVSDELPPDVRKQINEYRQARNVNGEKE